MNGTRLAGAAPAKQGGSTYMAIRPVPLVVAALLAAAGASAGAEGGRLAPVPRAEALSTHGPFEMGACGTCHVRSDPADPGGTITHAPELCFECHDEFEGRGPVKLERATHPAVKAACTACHNPHNSRKKKLRM